MTCKSIDVPRFEGLNRVMPLLFVICALLGFVVGFFWFLAIVCAVAWGMRKKVCARCGSAQILPLDSPRSREVFRVE